MCVIIFPLWMFWNGPRYQLFSELIWPHSLSQPFYFLSPTLSNQFWMFLFSSVMRFCSWLVGFLLFLFSSLFFTALHWKVHFLSTDSMVGWNSTVFYLYLCLSPLQLLCLTGDILIYFVFSSDHVLRLSDPLAQIYVLRPTYSILQN